MCCDCSMEILLYLSSHNFLTKALPYQCIPEPISSSIILEESLVGIGVRLHVIGLNHGVIDGRHQARC